MRSSFAQSLVLCAFVGCGGATPAPIPATTVDLDGPREASAEAKAGETEADLNERIRESLEAQNRRAFDSLRGDATLEGELPLGSDPAEFAEPAARSSTRGGSAGSMGRGGEGSGLTASAAGPLPNRAPPPPSPTGAANVGNVTVRGGSVRNASAVADRMRVRFRACYRGALERDPSYEGAIELTATIGPKGEVTSVRQSGDAGAVVPCAKAVVASGWFAPPQGGVATTEVTIPVSFTLSPPRP